MTSPSGRILTTHVGSLPRSKVVTDIVFAREAGVPVDDEMCDRVFASEVRAAVERQR